MSQRIPTLGRHPFPGDEEPSKRPRPTSNLRGDPTTSAVNRVSFIISTSNSQPTPPPPARHFSFAFEGGSPNAVIDTAQLTLPLPQSVNAPQAQSRSNPTVAGAAPLPQILPRLRLFAPKMVGVTPAPPATIPTPPTQTFKLPQQADQTRSAAPIDLTADDEDVSLLLALTAAHSANNDVIPTSLSPAPAPTSPDLSAWAPSADVPPHTFSTGFSAGDELGPDENGDLILDPQTSFSISDSLIQSEASSSTGQIPSAITVDGGVYAPTVEDLKQNSFLARYMDGAAPAASSSSVAPISRRWKDSDAWLKFLVGEGPDDLGRLLTNIRRVNHEENDLRTADILLFDARFLEGCHNYIQRLFPTPEPSNAEPTAPVLCKKVRDAFFDPTTKYKLQENLRLNFFTMLLFYGFTWNDEGKIIKNKNETHPHCFSKRKQWLYIGGQHNFLRITRILRSLSLLGLENEAKQFFEALKGLYTEGHDNYTEECTREFLSDGQKNREFIPDITRSVWETAIESTQP